MIKFEFEFNGIDEVFEIANMLLDLSNEINEEELLMKETKFRWGDYIITYIYGYEELEECIVRRIKNV